MKLKYFSAIAFFATLASCSTESVEEPTTTVTSESFPLTEGNYWTYDVQGKNLSERDSLYVGNDTIINSKTYKKIKTLNWPFGSFSTSLNNNGLRKAGNSVLLSGGLGIDLGEVFPIDLSLNDFVILKEDATPNEELSFLSGVMTQEIEGYPLTFEYSLKTTALENMASFTSPNGDVYTDVKKVKTALNLKISTTITYMGIPFTIPIMDSQEVMSSVQYYSNNIGMVYNHTTISYELADLSQFGVTLPIPESASQTQEEFLDTYIVE